MSWLLHLNQVANLIELEEKTRFYTYPSFFQFGLSLVFYLNIMNPASYQRVFVNILVRNKWLI